MDFMSKKVKKSNVGYCKPVKGQIKPEADWRAIACHRISQKQMNGA